MSATPWLWVFAGREDDTPARTCYPVSQAPTEPHASRCDPPGSEATSSALSQPPCEMQAIFPENSPAPVGDAMSRLSLAQIVSARTGLRPPVASQILDRALAREGLSRSERRELIATLKAPSIGPPIEKDDQ